jgi:hypothetical protein
MKKRNIRRIVALLWIAISVRIAALLWIAISVRIAALL